MTEQLRALVVDDEGGIRLFLTEVLRKEGHNVAAASSGEEALDCLRDNRYDLVLLDLRLGGRVDGLRVLESVKWRWPETVVIILTAYASLDSALTAIREGVDGYLLKPVQAGELRHAVQEALERNKRKPPVEVAEVASLQVGPFSADLQKHMITLDDQPLELTFSEFELLVHLMQNTDRVITPQELVQVVRGYECEDVFEAREIIKWYVHRLRRKVEVDAARPRHILNVRGVGYTFKG
jgi:two-component system response regulator RegX3